MTALTVGGRAGAIASGDVVPVVASLPISLVGSPDDRPADLVAVDGVAGWPEQLRASLEDGTRGLVLVHPCPAPAGEVPDETSVPVVVDYRFAGNPALPAAGKAFSGWSADALVELAAVVPDAGDLPETLVDQLATLRRMGLAAAEVSRLVWDGGGYYLLGSTTGGSPILLSAHVTSGTSRSLQLRGLGAAVGVELTLPDPGTAQPAILVRTTPEGATTAPTLWETSHRAAWRRLTAAVTGVGPTSDLADLRADLAVARSVLPSP